MIIMNCNTLNKSFIQLLAFFGILLLFSCDNSTEPKDCAGVSGGDAFIDDCGVCISEESGLIENYLMDCAGLCAGISQLDNCGNCDDDPTNDCGQDCNDDWGGTASENECGCVEGNTGLANGWCYGCTDSEALNYNSEATIDNGTCEYPACETIIDLDGNEYETVLLGSQCWMAENLMVTHYRNGDIIPTGYSDPDWTDLSTEAYAIYPWDNDDISHNTCEGDCAGVYGKLYNWYAVGGTRDICPDDWHVPSDDEWMELGVYLGGAINESGLYAISGGRRYHSGSYGEMGTACYFWSSTEHSNDSDNAYARVVYNGYYGVTWGHSDKRFGYSVRCLRD
jgi:hypothetical protein